MRRVAVLVGVTFALTIGVAGAARGPAATEIEESLTCQCGCGLTVHSCNHLQCGSAIPLKQEIAAKIEEGLGHDAILLHFRDQYGEKILSSPTTEGFSLTAWILPFVALGAGSFVVIVVVRRWSHTEPEPVAPEISSADRDRIARALDEDR